MILWGKMVGSANIDCNLYHNHLNYYYCYHHHHWYYIAITIIMIAIIIVIIITIIISMKPKYFQDQT